MLSDQFESSSFYCIRKRLGYLHLSHFNTPLHIILFLLLIKLTILGGQNHLVLLTCCYQFLNFLFFYLFFWWFVLAPGTTLGILASSIITYLLWGTLIYFWPQSWLSRTLFVFCAQPNWVFCYLYFVLNPSRWSSFICIWCPIW